MSNVRTRFAPSPTGWLHIGGARTALFNYLFARHYGGQFILRIDDTDQDRNRQETLQPILDGFRWLGLTWDEGPEIGGPHEPYFQSERRAIYEEWAHKLLASGALYRDYSTAEERAQDKAAADAAHLPYRFREKLYTAKQVAEFEQAGAPYCLRLRIEPGRNLVLNDLVRGMVSQNTDNIGDPVVLRSDGSPLYTFATVVDDVTMSISHVIRSEEHLTNTFSQMLIYEAMGFTTPQFAHLPYVAAPGSKKKMSKRDAGAGLHEYMRDYLPQAVVNYLALLGWSLDGETEFFSMDDLIANFGLDRVVNAPASHDGSKLFHFQGEWMKKSLLADKLPSVLPILSEVGLVNPNNPEEVRKVKMVIRALGDRLKRFSDIIPYGGFFFKKDIEYDLAAVDKRLNKPGVDQILADLRNILDIPSELYSDYYLHELVEKYATQRSIGMGLIVNALRVAVTGQAVGPGLYDCLVIIGKDKVLERIQHAITLTTTG